MDYTKFPKLYEIPIHTTYMADISKNVKQNAKQNAKNTKEEKQDKQFSKYLEKLKEVKNDQKELGSYKL